MKKESIIIQFMLPKKATVITLGCSKNLVDSEQILYQLKKNGYQINHDDSYAQSDLVLVNTCGFIHDAKQESIDTILELIEAQKEELVKDVRVFGCLSERYRAELEKEIPEIKNYYGTYELDKIYSDLQIAPVKSELNRRVLTTPKHYAYVKISDGCDRTCSFCAIPLIKGAHRSRPLESIVAECKYLAKQGTKEIILIAQDLSYYGIDIDKTHQLAELIRRISEIEGIEWIRMHYLYPANFPFEVLEVMKTNPKLCRYIDLALQHISDAQLKKMRRRISKQNTIELIDTIRKNVPDVALRTTMLIGHPDESNEDFDELIQFVKSTQFDRLGGFTYSDEENTFAAIEYTDNVPEKIKKARFEKLMTLQQEISRKINLSKVGQTFKTIIDREDSEFYYGRTEFDSPEVDNEVIIEKNKKLKIGHFYTVEISDYDDFDLIGQVIEGL